MELIIAKLQALQNIEISASLLAGLAMALEFGLRLVKSDRPLSIMHGVAGGIKVAANLVHICGDLLTKLADMTDKVLPQKIK